MGFRKDFVWGAATSSYQIEGAAFEDGKGLSVWDMFCRKEGAIKDGHTGDVACDHYHRYKEDVALMKEIGLKGYRLSISWPRVLPEGTGRINEKGLDFYDRLIDELLTQGIEPYVTLFHWDYPYELYKKGGWLNLESPEWFADYTRVIVERLSDRVKYWFTINEPQVFVTMGHLDGTHAPGLKLGMEDVLTIGHNVLLAHGRSVQTIREYSRQIPVVSFAPVASQMAYPDTDSEEDVEAARQTSFAVRNTWSVSWWFDPIFKGYYPDDGLKLFNDYLPKIKDKDFEIISQPLDFLGFNIYHSHRVKMGVNGKPELVEQPIANPRTAFNWDITPENLYWVPKFLYERYRKPLMVTENGMAGLDWVSVDGKVHDPQRIDFLHRHLINYRKAAEDVIDLLGYFCWSIMDNFEWAEGYNKRFGLVHVDYQTQKRTLKDSAYWYKKVIESNGEIL